MARNNKKIKIRLPEPDPVYGNRQLTKLVNQVMKDGKNPLLKRKFTEHWKLPPNQPKDPCSGF